MNLKHRLSASVDGELIAAAEEAVARGRAPSVSAWVNDALRLKREHERRLGALAAFVAAFEAQHGRITAEDMESAARRARARATPVRAARGGAAPSSRRRAG
jgi:Arc/MetJ-type ribon-helix-helix transcriptional regulator